MTAIIMNPGTGSITDAYLEHAKANILVFKREVEERVGLPSIVVVTHKRHDDDGRFSFTLRRGKRKCPVEMPGLPLDQVRYVDGAPGSVFRYPRLYVDGNSWLWMFAVNTAEQKLFDHDGKIRRREQRNDAKITAEYERDPRCPKCRSVFSRESVSISEHESQDRLVCRECEPRVKDIVDAMGFAVKIRYMPPAAAGGPKDPLCGSRVYDVSNNDYCRLKQGHWKDGSRCEGYYKVVERGKYVGRGR